MRRLSLILTFIGLFTLILILFNQTEIIIFNSDNLQNFKENQQVIISGKVTQEYYNENLRSLVLDSGIELSCSCKEIPPLKNKKIEVIGMIDHFNQNKIIKILKIRIK